LQEVKKRYIGDPAGETFDRMRESRPVESLEGLSPTR
jgi:hypothetical protein